MYFDEAQPKVLQHKNVRSIMVIYGRMMATVLLNQKYEMFPAEEQKKMLDRWLQYCRQTYNSALSDKERKYKQK